METEMSFQLCGHQILKHCILLKGRIILKNANKRDTNVLEQNFLHKLCDLSGYTYAMDIYLRKNRTGCKLYMAKFSCHMTYSGGGSMVRVCERTIPTERPPLVSEVIANFCR
jgi:hypothetical protein